MSLLDLRPIMLHVLGVLGLACLAASCGRAVPEAPSDTPPSAASPDADTAAVRGSALVLAAASLTAPFEQLARDFETAHPGTRIQLSFGGTPQLVLAVREGARADVFASADEPNMQKLVEGKHTAAAPQRFARNALAIVVAKGNPKQVRGLADLARPELRVLLCGPEVPAGKYARQALAKANVTAASRSDEPSVKAVLTKVQLGEADAGVVYVTDAAAGGANVEAVAVPAEHDVEATYPIATLSTGTNPGVAAAFVAHVLSPAGQQVLRSFGFRAP